MRWPRCRLAARTKTPALSSNAGANHSNHLPTAQIMSVSTIEESTLDAWRIGATLSAFLLCLTFGAVVFNVENEQAIQRCLRSDAEKSECLLTVYGR